MGINLERRIVAYMRSKQYQVFTEAFNYNIVYVEGMNADGSLNPDVPNCFNDRRLVLEIIGDIPKILGRICKLKIDTSCSGRKRENMSILISENQPE